MVRLRHLSARFVSSLLPIPVRAGDVAFVEGVLTPQELALWREMPRADRVESVRTARRAEAALADDPRRDDWLAAALLHDVGKLDARFGPYRRAVATVAGSLAPGMTNAWRESGGFTRRVGLYLQHAELGALRIRVVGGREVAAAWAEVHHLPERWDDCGIPLPVCEVLAAADGEIAKTSPAH